MRTMRAVLAVLGAIALGVSAIPAATAAPPQAPLLNVLWQGKQAGEFSARVLVDVRCSGGAIVQDLYVEAVQGGVRGSAAGDQGVVCDGVRRVVEVVLASSGAPFEIGYADVRAELLLLDPVQQDPLPMVSDEQRVWLVAPIQARVADTLTLNRDGSLTVRVQVRCQTPWVEAEFGIEVSQREGTVAASSYGHQPTCDGRWQPYTLRMVGNKPFWAVRTAVLVSGSVLEPENLDPVGGMYFSVDRPARRA